MSSDFQPVAPPDEGIAMIVEQWRTRAYELSDGDRVAANVYLRCADRLETFWRGVRDGRREEPAK